MTDDDDDTYEVSGDDLAWWKPVVLEAADEIECDDCERQLRGVADEIQAVIDDER